MTNTGIPAVMKKPWKSYPI